MRINGNFLTLEDDYLFRAVARRTAEYQEKHPGREVIRLSIGDVTRPLPAAAVAAMRRAVEEMGAEETFHGYGPERTSYGYGGLLESIQNSYAEKGVSLGEEEIFISDGAKSDLGNLLDLFAQENAVLMPDPVYPAYRDANVMAGRRILFAEANGGNGFLPMPERGVQADLIYLCSPNNPTGAAYTREQLKEWVDYANRLGAVILYDAAYEHFIVENQFPRSVYEVEGAKECAVEICSFSKTAGFTGVRCGYTVVPKALKRSGVSLNRLWARRQAVKFNGVSYISQMGGAAVFTPEGERQLQSNISYYRDNAKIILACLKKLGIFCTGGVNSPYIWLKCPLKMTSWQFFDYLLERANVVGTPGCGFGKNGEGYFRLTAFGSRENTKRACERLYAALSAHIT